MKTEETAIKLDYTIPTIKNIEYAGGYNIGGVDGLRMCFTTKPNWFHRKMMKLCLGWEWTDTNKKLTK
jgi:hypothetical protein